MAAAVTAALLTWHDTSGTTPPDDRAAIAAALVDLGLQPAVRYRTTTKGSTWTEMRVTASGAALGEAAYDGTQVTTMSVGGTTYVKLPGSGPTAPDGSGDSRGDSDLAGQWVVGAGAAPGAESADTPEAGQSPSVIANRLLKALNSEETTLPGPDAPPVTVGGVPALRATTPQGVLYVSEARPHRLLEFRSLTAPGGAPADRTGTAAAQAVLRKPAATDALAAVRAWADTPAAGSFTVAALSRAESATLAGEFRDSIPELRTALDAGITAEVETEPDLDCAATGCEVTSRINGITLSREARKRITGGQVTVRLTAVVQIEGRPAGTCTATEVLPLDSTGDIACTDTDAGSLYAAQEAVKRREAQSRSRVSGVPEPYGVRSTADAHVRVLAEVDTTALQQAQRQDEQVLVGAPSPADVAERAASTTTDDEDRPQDCARSLPRGADPSGDGWILNSLGANGRTETGQACLKKPPNNSSGSGRTAEKKPDPFGYAEARLALRRLGLDPEVDLARCHIIAARFGGSNKLKKNLSPCGQQLTNNFVLGMSNFENQVAKDIAEEPDGSVRYLVQPFFRTSQSSIPKGYVMIAVCYSPAGVPYLVTSRTVLNMVEASGTLTNIGN
ncbi:MULTISPECIES: DNA/RNA non-specific endonuclease [unclassified Streptomyces]|uniref:DNA/RNA non-specific endonuclease n=1 Tax=unclassified Streptomyces TaxID=2593676 RepID=UPI0036E554A2